MLTQRGGNGMKKSTNSLRSASGAFWLLFFSLIVPTVCFADALYWETKAPMPTNRDQAQSGVVNGKLYVLGGAQIATMPPAGFLNTVESYDPATDTWETKTPLTVTRAVGCSVTQGNYIYIVGGGSYAPPVSSDVIRYDTSNGVNSIIGHINSSRMRSSCEIINNKIYVVGGSNCGGPPGFSCALDTMEVYDLSFNTVTQTVPLPRQMDLPVTAAKDGKLYMFGGYLDYTHSLYDKAYPVNSSYVYDPAYGTTTSLSPMLIGEGGKFSAVLPNGMIYIPGGMAQSPPTLSNMNTVGQIYDPVSNGWTVRSGEPMSKTAFSPAGGFINGRMYLAGGTIDKDTGVTVNTTRSGYAVSTTDTTVPFSSTNSITASGVTLASTSGLSSGILAVSVAGSGVGTVPSGVVSSYYDLATSSDFSGNVSVTVPYNKVAAAGNESSLKLYHWNGSSWDNITTSIDTVNGTITGVSPSLSPFVVGGATGTGGIDSVTINTLAPGSQASASITGTTLNLGVPQGLMGPTGPQGPAGSPDTQSQILGKIATAADSTVLTMQQGPTESGSAVKFTVKNSSGTPQIVMTAGGSLTVGTSSLMVDSVSKNVGVGTATPIATLHAKGKALIPGTGIIYSSSGTVTGVGTTFTTQLHPGDTIMAGGQTAIITAITSNTYLKTSSIFSPALSATPFTYSFQPTVQITNNSDNPKVTITEAGNVGIGISTPTKPIDIVSTNNALLFSAVNDGVVASGQLAFETYADSNNAGSAVYLRQARGRLAAPADVQAGDRLGAFFFAGWGGGAMRYPASIESAVGTGTISSTSLPGYIKFMTAPNGSVSRLERVRIDQNGNVGIGTTMPTQKLEINGNVKAAVFIGDGSQLTNLPINTGLSKPGCSSTNRGTFWYTAGDIGVKDTVEVCTKDDADAYAWRMIW